ncbi:hypothetical protein [Kitasatospora sp. NPDC101183]|uniref:hypothetical protein n=1 Tax=Kitasatospora sp. NPDC101183 TaxID=3364100 RepID=UPI0038192A72
MNRPSDALIAIGIIGVLSGGVAALAFWVLPGPADLPLCLMAFGAVLNSGVIVSEPILLRRFDRSHR